jgi:2-polyprenyl-3-methyl-5-hydroxy-6-metoxy-1,4-benzoquinol methylase
MDCKSDLDEIARHEKFGEGVNGKLMQYRYDSIRPYFSGERCLELGCADGLMTKALVSDFQEVVAVDGSQAYCDITQTSIDAENLSVVHSLFQDFDPDDVFDTIIACHILEHVDDPEGLLRHIKKFLSDDGRLIIDVPNANSVHRRVGVEMGLLDRTDELNQRDMDIGHERVYRRDEFHSEIKSVGFKIEHSGGVFLKPVSNSQMEKWFSEDMMDGFAAVGRDFPEIAAEVYCVCSK